MAYYDIYRVAVITGGHGFKEDLESTESGRRLLSLAEKSPSDVRVHDDCMLIKYSPFNYDGSVLYTCDRSLENAAQELSMSIKSELGHDRVIGFYDSVHGDDKDVEGLRETNVYFRDGFNCTQEGDPVRENVHVSASVGGIYQSNDSVGFYLLDKSGNVGTCDVPVGNMKMFYDMSVLARSMGSKDIALTETSYDTLFNGKSVHMDVADVAEGVKLLKNEMHLYYMGCEGGRLLSDNNAQMIARMGEIYRHGVETGLDLPGRIYFSEKISVNPNRRNPVVNGVDFSDTGMSEPTDDKSFGS